MRGKGLARYLRNTYIFRSSAAGRGFERNEAKSSATHMNEPERENLDRQNVGP